MVMKLEMNTKHFEIQIIKPACVESLSNNLGSLYFWSLACSVQMVQSFVFCVWARKCSKAANLTYKL